MPSFTISQSIRGGGADVNKTTTYSADHLMSFNVTFPPGTNDTEVTADIDVSQIVAMFLSADQLTLIQTNTADGVDQILLTANVPFVWANTNAAFSSMPFTVDITSFFISNYDVDDTANVNIEILIDPTI